MDQDLSPTPTATAVSVVVAFPATGQPNTFLQSGGWIAMGMAVDGQSNNCCGNDYAILAMLYVPYSGQPMILGEDWVFNDILHYAPNLNFGEEWTCSCLTASTYSQLTTLTMTWSSTGSLIWSVTIGGVPFTLGNSYKPTDGQQPTFHVGTFQGTNKYEWFQFGVMTPVQNPLNGWNAYVGIPRYLQPSGLWANVQKSTWFGTTVVNLMDDQDAVGGYLGNNQGESCRTSYNFPGISPTQQLSYGQLIVHPAGSLSGGHLLWDSSCQEDVYPPGASFSAPSAGSSHWGQFTVSMTNFDSGPVVSGVALCFWSVESLNSGSWTTTLSAQLVGCNSSQTVSTGSSGYCQSQGSNTCRVNAWSEDYLGNIGGTTTLMLPGSGDAWTENSASSWNFLNNGVGGSSTVSNDNSAGNFKVASYSIKANWAGMNPAPTTVGLNYPSTGNLGLDFTTFGTGSNPPVIIFFVKSDRTVYYPQVQFVTSSPNAVFTGDSLPDVNGVSASDWQAFQVRVGPYGDNFVSGPGANWANINKIQFLFSFNAPGPASGDIWVDGVVFQNSVTTTRYFSIGADPDFSLSASSPVYTRAGQNVTVPVTVAADNTFQSAMYLSGSAPSGWGISMNTLINLNNNEAVVDVATIGVPGGAYSGSYLAQITATSQTPFITHYLSITIVVCPCFSVTASPSSLSIPQGGSGISTITVASIGGFSGTVTLSAVQSPQTNSLVPCFHNLSCTSNTDSIDVTITSGGSGSVTLSIFDICSSTGSYSVAVTGTFNTLSQLITIPVTVTSANCGGGGGSVAFGTLITMANGSRVPVQNLQIGDTMLGYDVVTGQYTDSTVKSIKIVVASNMLVINTATGTPLRVDASPTEILWTKLTNGTALWLPVTQLAPGDSLFTQSGWVQVGSIQSATGGTHIMYDITASFPYFANGYLDPPKPS